MTISLPLRTPAAMHAGVVNTRTVTRRVRRRGKRRVVRRRVTTLKPSRRVAFGERVRVEGRLESSAGQPVPNAPVQVFSRGGTAPEQLIGVIQTDADGRYAYQAQGTSSHTLRFAYQGTAVMLPAAAEVTILARAASTIRARPRRLLNGQAVRFSGRLLSLPAPPAGKLVELQVVLSGRWQTFRTALTDAAGHWRLRYRFRRSCGLTRFRFRARLPAEAGYAFETGRTRAVRVRVRGRPCS
jgi:hypothetical protein